MKNWFNIKQGPSESDTSCCFRDTYKDFEFESGSYMLWIQQVEKS